MCGRIFVFVCMYMCMSTGACAQPEINTPIIFCLIIFWDRDSHWLASPRGLISIHCHRWLFVWVLAIQTEPPCFSKELFTGWVIFLAPPPLKESHSSQGCLPPRCIAKADLDFLTLLPASHVLELQACTAVSFAAVYHEWAWALRTLWRTFALFS